MEESEKTGISEEAVVTDDPAKNDTVNSKETATGAASEDKFVAPFDINSLPEDQKQLVNEKFKQLEKAYYEKTRKLAEDRRVSQQEKEEISKLKEELETIKKDIYSAEPNDADNLTDDERRALEVIDKRAREIVASEMQPWTNKMIDEEIKIVSDKHKDFFEYAPRITEYIIRTKDKTTGKNTVSLEEAYNSVKGVNTSYEEAIKEGKRLAYAELEQKKKTSVSSVSPNNSSGQIISGKGSFGENLERRYNEFEKQTK